MSKKILITGGCGFVGSSLAIAIKSKYPNYEVIAFDNLKRRGSELNISRLKELEIEFIHGDIRDKNDFEGIEGITTVIDAAAEPSVLAGIDGGTDYLVGTNLIGTINALDFARKNTSDFIFLSTSRVYPIPTIEKASFIEEETRFSFTDSQTVSGISSQGISEKLPLEGSRSLYGATKLSSELMIAEYSEFFGLNTVINRCGVISGPYQMGKVDQGVVVLWMARHFWKKGLGYFGYGGEGKQVRDILNVQDLFDLVDWQMHNMSQINGKTYNAGGGLSSSASLQELTAICEEITGNKIDFKKVPETRAADLRIYITDNTKITKELNWSPKVSVRQTMEEIFEWLKSNESSLKAILS